MSQLPAPSPEQRRAKLRQLIEKAKKRDGIRNTSLWADAHGISRSAVTDIIYGRYTKDGVEIRPRLSTLESLSIALEVGIDELIFLFLPNARKASQNPSIKTVSLHVAGWVGAGPDQNMLEFRDILVDRNIIGGRTATAFKIKGDSMDAGKNAISDGDIVLVDINNKGHDQAIVVARLVSDGYVCKMLKDDKFGKNLVSKNPNATNGTPPYIPASEVSEIIGRVFYVFKNLD